MVLRIDATLNGLTFFRQNHVISPSYWLLNVHMLRSALVSISAILVILSVSDGHPVPVDDTWAEMSSSVQGSGCPAAETKAYENLERKVERGKAYENDLSQMVHFWAGKYPQMPALCNICNNNMEIGGGPGPTGQPYSRLTKELSKSECNGSSGCQWEGKMFGKGSCKPCRVCTAILKEEWFVSEAYQNYAKERMKDMVGGRY